MTNGTRRGWGVSVTPWPLFTPGKDPVPIVQEAGWAPGPVWTGAENLAPTRIRSLDRPACSQSLNRLCYPARVRAISITYSEGVFAALGIQHAMCMCHIVICCHSSSTLFFHILINGMIFNITLLNIKCVFISSTIFIWNISHSKKNWVRYDHKCILVFMWSIHYSCQIEWSLNFLDRFKKKILKYKIPRKSVRWELSCSVWTDRLTWWSE